MICFMGGQNKTGGHVWPVYLPKILISLELSRVFSPVSEASWNRDRSLEVKERTEIEGRRWAELVQQSVGAHEAEGAAEKLVFLSLLLSTMDKCSYYSILGHYQHKSSPVNWQLLINQMNIHFKNVSASLTGCIGIVVYSLWLTVAMTSDALFSYCGSWK